MELIRGLYNLGDQHRGCAVTIGNFDGVHIGHQHLIKTVCDRAHGGQANGDQADTTSLRACAVSFEPLPVEYFLPQDKHPKRLTTCREKITRLACHGLDQLLLLRFNHTLANSSADQFIKTVLIDGLNTRYLLIGDDFRFGKDRRGTFETLQQASSHYGFTLKRAETLNFADERVSSTRIRSLLTDGNLTTAAELLGRDYSIEGRVEFGAQLGRTIGFPTANIALKGLNPPLRGVFAVSVTGFGNQTQQGIANVGVKPTVKGVRLSLEVHLLDFKADLYGRRLRISFLHKLRDEKKFAGIDELKAAIATDEQNARQWFTTKT